MLFFEGEQLVLVDSAEHRWPARWLHPEDDRLRRMRPCLEYKSFMACAKERKPRRVCLHRTYALGDILMLFPVARALHRVLGLSEPILIPIEDRHLRALGGRFNDRVLSLIPDRGVIDYGCDLHMELDHVLEADHRDPAFAVKDRLALFAEALGCRL